MSDHVYYSLAPSPYPLSYWLADKTIRMAVEVEEE